MKVLTMKQPWASLFVLREVIYETRTWRTSYRGPLAIHTSKQVDRAVCSHKTIQALLGKHGYTVDNLPTGKIIAVCNLINCLKVTDNQTTWAVLENSVIVSENNYFLGDFNERNYAWEVQDMQLLDQPIPAKGHLGLWEYDIDM
ncbi:ASCH domain-containing protein [Neobacillus cucumis]|uniref:ASCH domain-containing protein n=1 Tax=Neobacillus cucumis TaxID=1740721 RepID=UPI00203EF30F|nr:ASCH domain-containing protein [Neobacillus cucumis]MCM3729511.1 ASCH domain-containing protein [Neobacillus cucumis]